MSKELDAKIGKATVWSSVTEVITRLISPVVNIILARLLVPEAFGAVTTITMVTSFAEIFADAGFQKYIIQHQFASDEDLNRSTNVAFWTNFSVSTLIFALICIFRNRLASSVGNPELGFAICVASLNILFTAFSSIQMARYKRDLNFKKLFIARIGSAVIPLCITVPLAFIMRNFWALIIGTLSTGIFNAVVLTVMSKWRPKFFYDFKYFKEMFSFSAWTLLESIVLWLTSYVDVFIVGNILDDKYLGFYKTSMSTINSYLGIIIASTIPVLFSALSRYQNDDKKFMQYYFKFQRLTAVIALPMGAGILIYNKLVTQILLGSQWMETSGFIGIWGLTSAISMVITYYNSEVYRSKGKPRVSLFVQFQHLFFLIPVLLISVRNGYEALYISRSLIRFELIACGLVISQVMFGIKIVKVFKNLFPSIVSTAIMSVCGYGLLLISHNILWQFASVAICVVIYFLALFLLFPSIRNEVLQISFVRKIILIIKKSSQRIHTQKEKS